MTAPLVYALRFRNTRGWMDMHELWLRGHEMEWLEARLQPRLSSPSAETEEDAPVPVVLQAMGQRAEDR